MEQKALSIIIASINSAEKLKNTLGSISKQSFRDLELIFVDVTPAGEASVPVKDFSANGMNIAYISAPGKSTVGCSRANVPMIFTGNSWTKNSGKSCP